MLVLILVVFTWFVGPILAICIWTIASGTHVETKTKSTMLGPMSLEIMTSLCAAI